MRKLDGFPTWRDPRIPFAVLMTAYVVSGVTWMGFNRNPLQAATIVGLACALDVGLHRLVKKRWLFPLSAYISAMSLTLLLNFAHGQLVLIIPVLIAIASKYVITLNGRHFFNPSLFGVVMSLLFFGEVITTAPAYQWHGTWAVSFFIVTAALSLFVFKVDRHWLVGTFMAAYVVQLAIRAVILRHHLPPDVLFLGTISSPPFYLFLFFMLPDPKTSPPGRRDQVLVALAIVTVDLALHLVENLYTIYYAAFIVAASRFLWKHTHKWREAGVRASLSGLVPAPAVAAVALIVTVATAGIHAYGAAPAAARDVGFRLEPVAGLDVTMDPAVLQQVDPRVQHIAKWILSVGAAAAVADVDADGRQDALITSPLARPEDRVVMWHNDGDFRFSRMSMPAFTSLESEPAITGLPSGALFADVDSDADPDLLMLVSFGQSRLFENRINVGEGFVDITDASGLPAHTISVAANALDYDRDGNVDLYLANVMTPYLPGYSEPTPLNIFDLPDPAHPGDRRMLKFMHDGWHNAENGGANVLLRGRGNGSFEAVDIEAAGIPETHWSLSVGTGDFNLDGFPDLYVANDFGPDDLYLNRDGLRFERSRGRWFGDIGRDTYKGMNATVEDFDRNGYADIYVSDVHHSLQAEGSLLWMNAGVGHNGMPKFQDAAAREGVLNPDRFGWGAGAGDLDNNGWIDLVQANGMVGDRLDDLYDGCPSYWYVNQKLMQSGPEIHTYADRWGDIRGRCIYGDEGRRVYLNRGGASPRFVDAAAAVGVDQRNNSRGVAMADFDDDGRVDVLITNQHSAPELFRNNGTAGGDWLGIELKGGSPMCPPSAPGSVVTVRSPGEKPWVREVHPTNGFSAQNDARLHFGLGNSRNASVDVEVRWCGGALQTYRLETGRYHQLEQ